MSCSCYHLLHVKRWTLNSIFAVLAIFVCQNNSSEIALMHVITWAADSGQPPLLETFFQAWSVTWLKSVQLKNRYVQQQVAATRKSILYAASTNFQLLVPDLAPMKHMFDWRSRMNVLLDNTQAHFTWFEAGCAAAAASGATVGLKIDGCTESDNSWDIGPWYLL